MKATKLIALVLAVIMCLATLASCGDSESGKKRRTHKEGSENADDGFAPVDYGSSDFTFLNILNSDQGKDYYNGNYLDAEAITGDTLSDSVFERNLAVEEKYNVNILERKEVGNPTEVLRMFVMSGDFCYDVIYGWGYKMGSCITENYLADFNDLPGVDLTAEYWSPSAVEDLQVLGHNYLCINDISMNKLAYASFLFFNKQVAEDYNVATEFGDFYQLVRDGKWTLDTYLSMITSVSNDLDGNGVITKDDVYGQLGDTNGNGYAISSGVKIVSQDENGFYVPSFYNEKVLDIIDKVYPVMSNTKYCKDYEDIWADNGDMSGYADQWEYARSFFATDHCLFTGGSAFLTSEFRDMKSAYGIIPMPKYDEAQEQYISTVSPLAALFGIPATTRNDVSAASMERTANVLNYMAYKSNELVLPTYYDVILGGQRLDSPDDCEMLDIIRANIHYDFSEINAIAWDPSENGSEFQKVFTQMFASPTSATSTYKRSEKKLQKLLDGFYADIVALEEKNAKNKED